MMKRKRWRESACKPDSVPGFRPGGGHPSGSAVTGGLERPTRASSAAGHSIGSYLALLREGFTKPAPSPGPLVGSYPTFSPLPTGTSYMSAPAGGFPFCGTFRRVAPPGRYPAPCPLESGLSSSAPIGRARDHPAGSLHKHYRPHMRGGQYHNNPRFGGIPDRINLAASSPPPRPSRRNPSSSRTSWHRPQNDP